MVENRAYLQDLRGTGWNEPISGGVKKYHPKDKVTWGVTGAGASGSRI